MVLFKSEQKRGIEKNCHIPIGCSAFGVFIRCCFQFLHQPFAVGTSLSLSLACVLSYSPSLTLTLSLLLSLWLNDLLKYMHTAREKLSRAFNSGISILHIYTWSHVPLTPSHIRKPLKNKFMSILCYNQKPKP